MRSLKRVMFALALVGIALVVRGGDDAKQAEAIILKAVKAAGLDKDSDKPHAETWKDKGVLVFMGQKIEYDSDWLFMAPNKYRIDLKMDIMGQQIAVTIGTDGVKAFEAALGMRQEIEGDKLDYVKTEAYQLWVMTLHPLLRDKEFQLKTIPPKKVGAGEAVGVQVDRKGRPPIRLYFNKDSGLLVKLEVTVKNEFDGWKDALDEVYFDGYQDQDGRKIFSKLKVDRNGQLLGESTISQWRRIAPVDDKRFQQP
ncbi:MAG: hypothetical protein NZO58_07390 [Gemmataceae bacterium]|nr:hypothetical protein [Gemmataceae bacterium]